jgi:hypothetical protein
MKDAPKSRRGAFAYNPSRNETAESRKKILKKKKSQGEIRGYTTHMYIYTVEQRRKLPVESAAFYSLG